MSISNHYLHRCDVARARLVQDSYNAEKALWPPDIPMHLTGVRCRLVSKAQRIADTATGEYPIITNYLLLIAAGTDVRVGDRVQNVVDETGATDVSTYRIEAVLPRRSRFVHHLSAQLEKVR